MPAVQCQEKKEHQESAKGSKSLTYILISLFNSVAKVVILGIYVFNYLQKSPFYEFGHLPL